MKRTWMKQLGPEERRARTRLRAYGTEERRAWLHALPCVAQDSPVHSCGPWNMDLGRPHIQAMHVRARGWGAAKGGADDQVPACAVVHREAGELGSSQRAAWEERHGIDLTARAAELAEDWAAVEADRETEAC